MLPLLWLIVMTYEYDHMFYCAMCFFPFKKMIFINENLPYLIQCIEPF